MTRYFLHRSLGGPQDQSGGVRKTLPPPGFFCIVLYCVVFHQYLFLCHNFLVFCLLSLLTTQTSMTLRGFEPATAASDRPQTLALDRSATGIRPPDRPAHCESLYRLRYSGPHATRGVQFQLQLMNDRTNSSAT